MKDARAHEISNRTVTLSATTLMAILMATLAVPGAHAADKYWDNTGGTPNAWGNRTNWSTVVSGGATPSAIPGTSDDVIFSATPIKGKAQTVNLNGYRSVRSVNVLAGTVSTTIRGGGVNSKITIGELGIWTEYGSGGLMIGSSTNGQRVDVVLAGEQVVTHEGAGQVTIANNVSGIGSPVWTLGGIGGPVLISGNIASSVSRLLLPGYNTMTLMLRGNNSFTGGVENWNGTVQIGNNARNLGTGPLIMDSRVIGTYTAGDGGYYYEVPEFSSPRLEVIDNSSVSFANKIIVSGTPCAYQYGVIDPETPIIEHLDSPGVNTHTFTGGITGSNGVQLISHGDDKLVFSGAAINIDGYVHIGAPPQADGGSDTVIINSVIGPKGGVFQAGWASSRTMLNGTNTYNGSTLIYGGTLVVHGNSIPNASAVEINTQYGDQYSMVEISRGTETVATLWINGVKQRAGTYGSTRSAGTYKSDLYFSGTGVMKVLY